MAIKETTKKLHLIAYIPLKGKAKDEHPSPTVSVSRKYNKIVFPKTTVRELGLDGKFVRFYFEPIRRIIGWQIREVVQQSEMKSWKLVKATKGGVWPVYIKKLLAEFNGRLKSTTYDAVPVQKYREMNQLSEYKNQTFFFIELVDDPETLRKGVGNESLQEAVTTQ